MESKILTGLLWTTVSSGIIYCAVMLFKKAFSKKISPQLQYIIWWLLILRLLLPVTLDVDFKLIQADNIPHVTAAIDALTDPSEQYARDARQNTVISTANNPTDTLPADKPPAGVADYKNIQSNIFITLNWRQLALMIWMAGVTAGTVKLAISGIKLNASLNASAVKTSANVRRILNICRRRLGIKDRIKILTVADGTTPALTLSFWPKIIMPQHITDDKQIYYALAHELTHYKRKDYLCCLLLQLLRTLYWFNPFLWFAAREIRMDIESACDANVVARMQSTAVDDYAKTLIRLSSGAALNSALGMALYSTFKTVEKRIRGIYMIKKSKFGIKCAALLMASAIGILCFTTACQPVQKESAAATDIKNDIKTLNVQGTAGSRLSKAINENITGTSAPVVITGVNDEKSDRNTEVAATDILPPEVTEYAIWREDNRLKFVFAVYNPNKDYAIESPSVNIRAYDSNGAIISDEIIAGRYILPQSYWYCARDSMEEVSKEPDSSEFIVIATQESQYVKPDEIKDKAQNVKIDIDRLDDTGIYGNGIYPQGETMRPVTVITMYRDDNGKLTGGLSFVLNATLEDGITAPIKIIYDGDEKYITDNVEFHVQPW